MVYCGRKAFSILESGTYYYLCEGKLQHNKESTKKRVIPKAFWWSNMQREELPFDFGDETGVWNGVFANGHSF